LLERRPDIRAAEQQAIAANAHVGVALTNRFPRIALTAELGAKNDDLGDLLKSPFWFFAGDIVGPLFQAGKLKHEQGIAEAMYEGTIYEYQNTVLKAFHEVNSSLITVEKAKEITKAQRNLVRAAREYKRLGVIQYLNGVISYLDLLDAQRSLLNAEIDLNNAKRDELLAMVQLYKALGGGWSTPQLNETK
jgi:multidrug efflux system outer membrane protein